MEKQIGAHFTGDFQRQMKESSGNGVSFSSRVKEGSGNGHLSPQGLRWGNWRGIHLPGTHIQPKGAL
jgi:hypothetical protein